MAEIRSSLVSNILKAVLLIYIAAVLYGIVNHESWGDEAQPWLLVRDNDLIGLFRLLPAEGHPPLWYLIIFPFAHLGLPYTMVKWIAGIIMIAGIYLFFFKVRQNLALKILFPFSYFIIYKYAVFGRSYSLIVFFIMALAAVYPKRFEKPWLFALCLTGLFNTHILVFPFATALLAIYIFDAIQYKKLDKKVMAWAAIIFVCGFYLVPYLSSGSTASILSSKHVNPGAQMQKTITGAIVIAGNASFAVFALLICAGLLINRTKPFLLLIAGACGILYIAAYVYPQMQVRHAGVLYLIMVGAYCFTDHYKDDRYNFYKKNKTDLSFIGAWACAIIALFQLFATRYDYAKDVNSLYSGSKEAAEYLKESGHDQSIIVGYKTWSALAILPYLDKDVQYYDPECGCFSTYFKYDSCYTKETRYPQDSLITIAYHRFHNQLQNVVFVFTKLVVPDEKNKLKPLFANAETPLCSDEMFFVYKFRDGLK